MSKRTGPTRIPIFGPRSPVPVPTTNNNTTTTNIQLEAQTKKSTDEITAKDVGKRVRVADKEGLLRFVGNVHFSTGVWCGVELSSAVGKNDGCVRGVRYFACPESCGLMTPLNKVLLIDEIAEDATSGPYSMIFDVNDQLVNSTFNDDCEKQNNSFGVGDRKVTKPLNRSVTFDKSDPHDFKNVTETRQCVNATFKNADVNAKNAYTNTQITCDTTIVKIPGSNCENFVHNSSSDVNETIINISITNNRNTFNISTTDRNVLNIKQNRDSGKIVNPSHSNDVTFDVKTKGQSNATFVHDKQKSKVPSELNLKSVAVNETIALKSLKDTFDRPRSYPIIEDYFSPITGTFQFRNKVAAHSTPVRRDTDVDSSPKRRLSPSPSPYHQEDESNKRDSLDCEESLGILTPDQMVDASCFVESRSPSSENIRSLPNDLNVALKFQKGEGELNSPTFMDASVKDFSLGIMDENFISAITTKSDTTVNMELPLDTKSKDFILTRIEQTPSPEELPLDPTPIVDTEPKTEPTQSKTTSNFITSITSITSIDTGYQGDGEMSRPASRGADNSPLTRRPLPRPQPRRPEPMTDSDFYTESDADNLEEHPLRGDRRAQVIDGTLYGVDPQAAADIYANNRENMDSSGIFTDLESNTRTEELSSADNDNNANETVDVSPSDSSTKTISDNSQNNAALLVKTSSINDQTTILKPCDITVTVPSPKRNTPSPSTIASSPTSIRSPRHTNKEDDAKKFKMPKRNVASKVKAMIEPSNVNVEKKQQVKKTAGRWDAVMNKISKNQGDHIKNNLKGIKSKVFTSITAPNATKTDTKITPPRPTINQKSPNNKLRRVRTRATTNTTATKNATNLESSVHSSLSDLSGASPVKKNGSAKKQREVVRVTQVLTAAKLSPKANRNNTEVLKKKTTPPNNDVRNTNKRNLLANKEKKELSVKECGRTTAKGGRVSPGARPPQQQRVPVKAAPKTAEALAVLVQHLVFNLEAFRVPSLKKEVDKIRSDAEQTRQQLEEKLSDEKRIHAAAIEAERARCRSDVAALIEEHNNNVTQLKSQRVATADRLKQEAEEQILSLKKEFNRLQKTHAESLDILREENDAIREEIDEKNAVIDQLKHYKFESEKMKKDYEAKEITYKEHLQAANEEIARLKGDNQVLLNYSQSDGNSTIQEVQSLRAVLELKQSEVAELRKTLAEASRKAEILPHVEERVCSLTARCEDLRLQLEIKNSCEQQLVQEKKKLEDSIKEEVNQKKRLKNRNEELQWKLQQNKEVVNRVLEQAEESAFNRSMLSASFNERVSTSRNNLGRTQSFRERTLSNKSSTSGDVSFSSRKSKNSYELDIDDDSPPSSPKVKGVVEKSDSVSYVLEMDESPEVVASRIVRRSFRNSTPPKNTPTKSPSNKRPRMKNNPLSLSASASAIIPITKTDHMRSRSISVRNGGEYDTGSSHSDDIFVWECQDASTPVMRKGLCEDRPKDTYRSTGSKFDDNLDLDEEHDVDIKLPSLPSEIGRNDMQSLPVPRHLAGEAMISESNSDDESTTSSSSGQL